MSDLQRILIAAKTGLAPWEDIPESRWASIAAQCGPQETEELQVRIGALQAELETAQPWDGDTIDDIHKTIAFFRKILVLTEER